MVTRHHIIDWNFVGVPRTRPNKWRVEMSASGDVWKVQEGGLAPGQWARSGASAYCVRRFGLLGGSSSLRHARRRTDSSFGVICLGGVHQEWSFAKDDHGQHYYMERWERRCGDERGRGRVLALRETLLRERAPFGGGGGGGGEGHHRERVILVRSNGRVVVVAKPGQFSAPWSKSSAPSSRGQRPALSGPFRKSPCAPWLSLSSRRPPPAPPAPRGPSLAQVVGDHFAVGRGRGAAASAAVAQQAGGAAALPGGGSLVGLVDGALAAGNRALAEAFLTVEGLHGRVTASAAAGGELEWAVDAATHPWEEGCPCAELAAPLAEGGASGGRGALPQAPRVVVAALEGGERAAAPPFLGWRVEGLGGGAWDVLECSGFGPPAAQAAALEAFLQKSCVDAHKAAQRPRVPPRSLL